MAAQHNIIRTPKDADHPYLAISRALAQDKRLSYEARGVMLYLLSKPSNWQVRPSELEKLGCKRDKVYRILEELKQYGYLVREKQRGADGRIEWLPYRVLEQPTPDTALPDTALPDTALPDTALPDTENTEVVNVEVAHQNAGNDTNKQKQPHPALPYTEKPHIYIVEKEENKEKRERGGGGRIVPAPLPPPPPALAAYQQRYPNATLSPTQAERIAQTATDARTWQLALDFWHDHGHKPQNITGLLDKYTKELRYADERTGQLAPSEPRRSSAPPRGSQRGRIDPGSIPLSTTERRMLAEVEAELSRSVP